MNTQNWQEADWYNRATKAQPFKWTVQGTDLCVLSEYNSRFVLVTDRGAFIRGHGHRVRRFKSVAAAAKAALSIQTEQ